MCLDNLWTKARIKEWLKNKPEIITAYKVVKIIEGEAYPAIYHDNGPFEKTNKEDKCSPSVAAAHVVRKDGTELSHRWRHYPTLYHMFLTKRGATRWNDRSDEEILKCKIPKKQIVDIGIQHDCIAIITKEFTFVEGDKYFKEETVCASL